MFENILPGATYDSQRLGRVLAQVENLLSDLGLDVDSLSQALHELVITPGVKVVPGDETTDEFTVSVAVPGTRPRPLWSLIPDGSLRIRIWTNVEIEENRAFLGNLLVGLVGMTGSAEVVDWWTDSNVRTQQVVSALPSNARLAVKCLKDLVEATHVVVSMSNTLAK